MTLVVTLPAHGDDPWDGVLNVAIQDVVDAVNAIPSGGALVHDQTSPAATWTVAHPLGRMPSVAVYIGGQVVLTQVDATDTTVTVTFPSPQVGTLIIT